MKRPCISAILLFWSMSWPVLAADDDALPWKTIDTWKIAIDTTLANNCFVYSIFEGDSVIRIGFDQDTDLYLFVGDTDWKSLEEGKEYDFKIQFGDESPWSVSASAASFHGIPVLINRIVGSDNVALFLAEFMREHGLAVYYQGNRILNLSLKGSHKAGAELLECEKTMLSVPEPREDPFVTPSKSGKDPFAT